MCYQWSRAQDLLSHPPALYPFHDHIQIAAVHMLNAAAGSIQNLAITAIETDYSR